jgi:hypothetical protein
VQGDDALAYLLATAVGEDDRGRPKPNVAVLHALGSRYPDELVALVREHMGKADYVGGMMGALVASAADQRVKKEILLATATDQSWRKRVAGLRHLLEMRDPDAIPWLIRELTNLPRTPDEEYWVCSAGAVARLVTRTDDARVWAAVLDAARRVDMGQRLEMIEGIGTSADKGDAKAIRFLVAFLDDGETRHLRDRQPQADADRTPLDLFKGPSAGFTFGTLSVGDFAALQVARLLGIETHADAAWGPEDWSKLQTGVRTALQEQQDLAGGAQ